MPDADIRGRARSGAVVLLTVLLVTAGLGPIPVGAAGSSTGGAGAATQETGTASTVTVSLRPANTSVDAGNRTTFEVVVDGFDEGIGAYDITLNTSDAAVAPVVNATTLIEGQLGLGPSVASDGSGARLRALQTDTAQTGPLVVGTVTLRGDVVGAVDLDIGAAIVGNESDEPYRIGSRGNASLAVDPRPGVGLGLTANRSDVGTGGAVAFEVRGSPGGGRPIEYEWDFDDDGDYDLVTSAGVATYDFETPPGREWSATVRVTDDSGAVGTASVTLTSDLNRAPTAALSANRTTVAEGGAVRFSAAGSSDDAGIASYEWDLDGDGTTDATGRAAIRTYRSAGTYDVHLTVTDGDGASANATTTVTVTRTNRAPLAQITGPSAPTAGRTVTYRAGTSVDADGTITSYEWDLDGDGSVEETGQSVTTTFATPGSRTITLTVTDNDTATDTASFPVRVQAAPNEPPEAVFDVDPGAAVPDEQVTFDASASADPDGDDGALQYDWYVDGRRLTGRTVTETFATGGRYGINLSVTDEDGARTWRNRSYLVAPSDERPTARIDVRTGLVFQIELAPITLATDQPEINAGEITTLSASKSTAETPIVDYRWLINGPGVYTIRSGESVQFTFPRPGQYSVILSVKDSVGFLDFTSRTIDVKPPEADPKVSGVTASKAGAPIQGAPVSQTYEATITSDDPIRRVRFELGGDVHVDRDGSDGWTYTTDLGRLSGDSTLSVRAVDNEGIKSATATKKVDVVPEPAWLRALRVGPGGSRSIRRTGSGVEIVYDRQFFDFDVDFDVPVPTISGIDVAAASGATVVYSMPTRTAAFDADGSVGGKIVGKNVRGSVGGQGTLETQPWRLRNGRVSISAEVDLIKKTFEPDVPIVNPKIKVRVTAGAGATVQVGTRSGDVVPTGGQFRPKIEGSATVGIGLGVAYVEGSVEGGLEGYLTFRQFAPVKFSPALRAYIRFTGTIDPVVGKKKSVSVGVSHTFGNAEINRLRQVSRRVETVGEPKRLGEPPGGEGAVAARTLGAVDARGQALVGAGRVTRDRLEDQGPSIARANDTYTLVWDRQAPGGSAGDHDVYVATSERGTAWTAPRAVTTTNDTDVQPTVAATADRRLVAFSRVNRSVNRSVAAIAETELAYAVDDGDGFGPVTVATDDGGFDLEAAAVAVGGEFVVAWIHDPDGNVSTTADRVLRWARTDGGTLGSVRTVENATAVDLAAAPAPDGNGTVARLAYLESDDGTNGSVVRARLTDGGAVERARYPATGVTSVAAGTGGIAWTAGTGENTTVEYAPTAGARASLDTGALLDVRELDLVDDAGRTVLVYRGTPPGTTNPTLRFRRLSGGEWLAPRALAGGNRTNLTFVDADAAAADRGFVAVAMGKNLSRTQNYDLFAVRHEFAPDLVATVEGDRAAPGERSTVNYTVRNVGDRPATDAVVVVRNGSGAVASQVVGRIGVGERATGSVAVGADTAGTVTVLADPADRIDEFDETNNEATLRLASPDVAVSGLVERRRENELEVTATVTERAGVRPGNVTVVLVPARENASALATATVAPGAGGTATALFRIAPAAVNRSAEVLVVAAPERAPDGNATNDAARTRLRSPDLAVDGVAAGRTAVGSQAGVALSNAGTGNATALLTLASNRTGRALTYRIAVPAATDGSDSGRPAEGRAVVRAVLYHPATEGGLEATVEPAAGIDLNGLDDTGGDAIAAGNATLALPALAGVNATASGIGGTVSVRVRLDNAAGIAVGTPLSVRVDGAPATNATAVVAANASRTVTEQLSLAPGEHTIVVSTPNATRTLNLTVAGAPDPDGDGRPATDPDGDGRYEDVTGDGQVNVVDVAVLLDGFDRVPAESAALFDFSDDGTLNIVDVAELLDRV